MKNTITQWLKEKGGMHFTLIDPDKQKPDAAARLAESAELYGSDAIMVGGSTCCGGVTDETVKAIKDACKLPIILFPSTAEGVSPRADYLFFMMLLNSKNRRFLVGEQVNAAPHLKDSGLKPISMGYIVVSTSSKPTAVEVVGEVDRIGPDDVGKAVAYALTAQYYGMHCVYLEAGSGADKPVSDEIIRVVKESISIPLIVGGGIRDPETAKQKISAGADVIVTGTIAEDEPEKLEGIIKAVKSLR